MDPRVAQDPLPVAPHCPASLAEFDTALRAVLRGPWFDKAAFDDEIGACGASDGALHAVSDWDAEHLEYPDDPSPKATTREFGHGSIMRDIVSAPYLPAPATPTGSDEAHIYADFAKEAMGLLRHVDVPLERCMGIVPCRWGGPSGDVANRVNLMAWRLERKTRFIDILTLDVTMMNAGDLVDFGDGWSVWAIRAETRNVDEFPGHAAWVASMQESHHYDDAHTRTGGGFPGPGIYADSFDEEGYSHAEVPATLELQKSPSGVYPPQELGYSIQYPIVRARRYDYDADRYEYAPVVDPDLAVSAAPAKFQFTAPCAGRLLLHVCATGVNSVSREDSNVWTRHVFDGGGVWAKGWNAVAVAKGVNVLDRPHLPGAPDLSGFEWRKSGDGWESRWSPSQYDPDPVARATGCSETVGCRVDRILFEPAFTHLAT